MRNYRLLVLAAVLILMPSLAKAGGKVVPLPEPGSASLLGAGMLALACVSGVLTVKNIIAGRRFRSTSIEKA